MITIETTKDPIVEIADRFNDWAQRVLKRGWFTNTLNSRYRIVYKLIGDGSYDGVPRIGSFQFDGCGSWFFHHESEGRLSWEDSSLVITSNNKHKFHINMAANQIQELNPNLNIIVRLNDSYRQTFQY